MKAAHLVEIVEALSRAQARYLIVGGLAVNAHGYLRYTHDVDLVVQLQPENVLHALRALEQLGYRPKAPVAIEQFADRKQREAWIGEKSMLVFPLWCDARVETPIDIFVQEPFSFSDEWDAAYWAEISEGVRAPFVRLETLLRLKREAARPQDMADISRLTAVRNPDERGS